MTTYELLSKHIEDLQAVLDNHGNVLQDLPEAGVSRGINSCAAHCSYKRLLKMTLLETIQILEASRKAFKSKQLESLRVKLTAVLAEIA
ncbi:MAG: hypothetical protein HY892_15785 [Deltaproteobacteria bacterium]|nr:hypothetical protein [Deltaproteobacteria bacterium]